MAVKDFDKRKPRRRFSDMVIKMENYLNELKSTTPFIANSAGLPKKAGVYVFYEKSKALYAGRTGNLRKRMAQHRNMGSRHNDAPFAYHLAKCEAKLNGISVDNTRVSLCGDDDFNLHFQMAKKRVGKMRVRFIEINDAREQSLFEYYASIELHTRWNDHSNT
jgi:hypothetical protein